MTTERRDGSQGIQPELPLPPPRAEGQTGPTGARASRSEQAPSPTDGWRLDERTRRIGRQGVAAARAQLKGGPRAGREKRSDRSPRPAGRAA